MCQHNDLRLIADAFKEGGAYKVHLALRCAECLLPFDFPTQSGGVKTQLILTARPHRALGAKGATQPRVSVLTNEPDLDDLDDSEELIAPHKIGQAVDQ